MKLYQLQIAVVAWMLLVGWGLASAPNMRRAPESLKRMCAAAGKSAEERQICDEFNAR